MTVAKRAGISKTSANDRRNIRELIENWAIWRDARLWDQFRTVWHQDGQIWATWFQGSYEDFIRMNDEGWKRGVRILHSLGGTAIDINGTRAIAQTRMTISQRAPVEGVLCDVVCTGRFYDFLEKRNGRWGIVLRRGIYEKDRIDPVSGAARPDLDQKLLARFPEGYRHLAYLQTRVGYQVRDDVPGPDGPQLDALYALGASWLSGGKLPLIKRAGTDEIAFPAGMTTAPPNTIQSGEAVASLARRQGIPT